MTDVLPLVTPVSPVTPGGGLSSPALRQVTPASSPAPRVHTRRTAPTRAVSLLGIGTAAHMAIPQRDTIALAQSFSCQSDGQRAWLERVFLRAGVEQRGSVLLGDRGLDDLHAFYGPPATAGERGPTTATRMQRYAREAPLLAARAATSALADAGVAPETITHLITVSCTGFQAPGLDVELIDRLALSPSVHRLHIGFMGCHAGFNALAAARETVLAQPHAFVLVCCVELCSLHFAYGWNPEKLIANALFADGASACIVGADALADDSCGSTPTRWRLLDAASCLLPDSRDAMTWRIGDNGFEMTLSAGIPALIRTHLRPWCDAWLARLGLSPADIPHWAIHPGGPKILTAAAQSISLPESAIDPSRTLLARQGNMSSATLAFLLQQLLRDNASGHCVALGFGPGLMAEGLLLEIT